MAVSFVDMRPGRPRARSLCPEGRARAVLGAPPYPVPGYHGYAKTGNPALRVMVGCCNSRAIYCRQNYTEADMMRLQHPRPRRPLARVYLMSKSSRSHFIPEPESE